MGNHHRSPYIGPSEAQSQANAEALARRGSPYTAASEVSFRVQWDHHRREPEDLRDCVRQARRAYSDEVPSKLHSGAELAQDGTPKMTAKAEGYIFGSDPQADDAVRNAETGERDLMGYHFTPFRAALDRMAHGAEPERKRAAIVSHVTIGSQGAQEAAIKEGVPSWCAKLVAEDALRGFLRSMTDIAIHARRQREEEAVA